MPKSRVFFLVAITALTLSGLPAAAQNLNTIEVLPSLTTYVNLIPGPSGTFYGVSSGGSLSSCSAGCGTVFQLAPAPGGEWTQTILHTFTGDDGAWPESGLVQDQTGKLYGTTYYGGASAEGCLGHGCGVVFELTPGSDNQWSETVLYSFTGGVDGQSPTGLVMAPSGALIGTTIYGGSTACGSSGCGVLFEVSKSANGKWQQRVLYDFVGGAGGQNPKGIVENSSGVFYMAAGGGVIEDACGGIYCGTLLEVAQNGTQWKKSMIHTFHGPDGAKVNGSLTLDKAGHIFGTTQWGGNGCMAPGCGVVFGLALEKGAWKEVVLHSFTNGSDGEYPSDGLALDAKGDVYGGTSNGSGVAGCNPFAYGACGQVFELSLVSGTWEVSAVYGTPSFYAPVGNFIFNSGGNLFGASCDEVYLSGGDIFEIAN